MNNDLTIKILTENIDILKNELFMLKTLYLEDHARQIDANKKISQRIDELVSKPYKCPVCNGCGRVLTEAAKVDFDGMLRADLPTSKDCKSCKGNGIVWG